MNKKLLAVILILGLVLRLLAVAARPLWYDEAFAILLANKGLSAFLTATLTPDAAGSAADVHPPAFYALLSVWMSLFGDSNWSARGLSILIGTLTLGLAYLLCRELFDPKTALVQMLLVAISPFHIHYSQEIRMYALLALATVSAAYALWKGAHTKKPIWWALFAISAALAQYTHNLAVFFLIPLALIPIFKKERKAFRDTAIACGAAVLLYAPWLIHLPAQFAKVQGAYWTNRPGANRIFTTLLTFVTNLPLSEGLLPVGLFIALLAVILGLWQTFRTIKNRLPSPGPWLAYLAFAPPILLFLVSQWQPVYLERALLPSGIFFALWLGWVLTQTNLPKPVYVITVALILFAAGVGIRGHITYRGFPYGPYPQLSEHLEDQLTPGDIIIHSNKLTMLPMVYYHADLPQTFIADPPGSSSDTLALPTQEALGLIAAPTIEAGAGEAKGIWLVIFARAIEEYQEAGYPTHPHISWLEENSNLVSVETWDDILLYRYEK